METKNGFNLRMPDDLKLKLKAAAVENDRSLNAEIIQRLRATLGGWKR